MDPHFNAQVQLILLFPYIFGFCFRTKFTIRSFLFLFLDLYSVDLSRIKDRFYFCLGSIVGVDKVKVREGEKDLASFWALCLPPLLSALQACAIF